MEIPAHVQSALGIASPLDRNALASAVDGSQIVSALGLSGAEFAEAVHDGETENLTYHLSSTDKSPSAWKYLELRDDTTIHLCATSGTLPTSGGIPTAIAQFLVKAWMKQPGVIVNSTIPVGLVVFGILNGSRLTDFASRLVPEWTHSCAVLEGTPAPPSWTNKTEMVLASGARFNQSLGGKVKYPDLFIEAVSELKIKWRFLALYRILEHGYLSEVYSTLMNDFFAAPKDSLKKAQDSVASEIKQFIALSKTAALSVQFEALNDAFENAANAGNGFAIAVRDSIAQNKDAAVSASRSDTGVVVCYKIRCSIVHAGLSAPIYDVHTDAPQLLEALIPTCESIAFSFLGISMP